MGKVIIALYFMVVNLALSIQSGESFRCYDCSSYENKQCADPINTCGLQTVGCEFRGLNENASTAAAAVGSFIRIPNSAYVHLWRFVCLKAVYSDQSGISRTFRGCLPEQNDEFNPCNASGWNTPDAKIKFCGTCDTDLCNGASKHSFTIISAFVVPWFAIIISRWIGV